MIEVGNYRRAILYILTYAPDELKRGSLVNNKLVKFAAYVWNTTAGRIADDVLKLDNDSKIKRVSSKTKSTLTQGSLFEK